MKKISESKLLTKDLFRLYEGEGFSFVVMLALFLGTIGSFVGSLVGLIVLIPSGSSDWTTINTLFVVVFGLITMIVPAFGRLHVTHGLPEYWGSQYKPTVMRYVELPPEDRELFPANVVSILKDPKVDEDDKDTLIDSMKLTLDEIDNRNAARAELERERVDITHAIEQVAQARNYVAIETKTYKEFM